MRHLAQASWICCLSPWYPQPFPTKTQYTQSNMFRCCFIFWDKAPEQHRNPSGTTSSAPNHSENPLKNPIRQLLHATPYHQEPYPAPAPWNPQNLLQSQSPGPSRAVRTVSGTLRNRNCSMESPRNPPEPPLCQSCSGPLQRWV